MTAQRKQYIKDTNDPEAFGKWSFEFKLQGLGIMGYQNLTHKVNKKIRNVVIMINKHEGWELESSEINLLLSINTSEPLRFDIM